MTGKIRLLAGIAALAAVMGMSSCTKRAVWKPYEESSRETSARTSIATEPAETLPQPDSSPTDSSTDEGERNSYVVDMEADLDWDGEPEWILFVAEQDKRPYVKVGNYTWMAEDEEYMHLYPFLDVLDVDGDGRAEIIAGADTGACGGYGGIVLHILKWENGELMELPLPTFGIGQGCDIHGEFLAPEKVKFYFPATNSEQVLDIKIENSFLQDEGWKNEEPYIDPIYAYHLYSGPDGSRGLVLEQYVWGSCHVDGIAILYSRVEWVNGEMRITHQKCVLIEN